MKTSRIIAQSLAGIIALFSVLAVVAYLDKTPPSYAQGSNQTPFDCQFVQTFTGSGAGTAHSNSSSSAPCVAWRVTFTTTTFVSATVQFETSPDNSSWSAVTNSICSSSVQPPCVIDGSNPITAAAAGTGAYRAYSKYVRINITGVSGSGSGQVVVYGYKGATARKRDESPNPGPVISDFTLTSATSSELLGAWTTSATADSTVQCGPSSGNYTITSETVNPLTRGYSVTDHSMTIAGLNPATQYFCRAITTSAGGTSTSREISATTAAAVSPLPFTVSVSALTRYNDQFLSNGRQMRGDSSYCGWAGDGNTYCAYQDGTLPNTSTPFQTMVFSWPTATSIAYDLATTTSALSNAPIDNDTGWRTMGVLSVWDRASGKSLLYDSLFLPQPCCSSLIKSPDSGSHWIAPQNNTGPAVVGTLQGDFPTSGHCMDCGVGFEHRYTPLVTCQDHRDCAGTVANERSYQYWFTNTYNQGLARMRLEDLTLQDGSKWQYYKGTQTSDDGNYAAAWTSTQADQTLFPVANLQNIWQSATYLSDFHQYIITSWNGVNTGDDPVLPASVGIYSARYPWSVPTLLATIPTPGLPFNNYYPAFPQVQLATYRRTSTSPLIGTIKLLISGYAGPNSQSDNPLLNQYSIFTYDLTLTGS